MNPWQGLTPAAVPRKPRRRPIPAFNNPWGLSAVQCLVLGEFTKGMTNKEIGAALGRSPRTVELHLADCRRVMGGVRSVQMAVMWDRFQQDLGRAV